MQVVPSGNYTQSLLHKSIKNTNTHTHTTHTKMKNKKLATILFLFSPAFSKKLLYVHGDTQICNSQSRCLFQDDEIKNLLQENNFRPSIETNRIDAVLSFDPCESYSIAKEETWRYFPISEVPFRPE